MPDRTARFQLVQLRLGRDLTQYVTLRRADQESWRTIAADLTSISGVSVSHETLRTWFDDEEAVA